MKNSTMWAYQGRYNPSFVGDPLDQSQPAGH
jgi:hypothetical protein